MLGALPNASYAYYGPQRKGSKPLLRRSRTRLNGGDFSEYWDLFPEQELVFFPLSVDGEFEAQLELMFI
ncbi:unnamed protein product [Arabis nemorensis]|uniref:Uncharacterized protein n=1 Tax=Arabis nemorensis TaxID=586526 RepID=A0A565B3J3_9BRAS|nr:unnamed protein product [Arabis nemorensis]